jgi:hypothetical protein
LGGIAEAALGGDRDALQRFAGAAVVLVERAQQEADEGDQAELAEWLIFALSRMQAGEEPNHAFGWVRPGRGRPTASKQDFSELRKRWLVGQHIAGLLAGNGSLSLAEACRRVAEDRHISEETARDIWKQWLGKKAVK